MFLEFERSSWRREQTAIYWPQVPLTIAALLSSFCWATQPWSGGPQALCLALALTTTSCPQLRLELELRLQLELNSACLELQLTQTVCGTWWYNCLRPPVSSGQSYLHLIQPIHRSRWYSDIFDLFLELRLVEDQYIIYIYIIYIYIHIYIVKSRWQALISWPSKIHLYHPSLFAGLLGCILCPYRPDASLYCLAYSNTSMALQLLFFIVCLPGNCSIYIYIYIYIIYIVGQLMQTMWNIQNNIWYEQRSIFS